MTTRTWKPNRATVGQTSIPISVEKWTWTKHIGLLCHYKYGYGTHKSDWSTLRAFEQAIKDGREFASEVL